MRVLVTDATINVGISIIEALSLHGHEIIAVDYRRFPFTSKSAFASEFHQSPELDSPEYGDFIWDLIKRTDPDVILPVLNCRWFVENLDQLKRVANILYPDSRSFNLAFNNNQTLILCHNLNVPAPKLYTQEKALELLDRLRHFPATPIFVVKPKKDFGGARGVTYISNREELLNACDHVKNIYQNYVIQEYIPGEEDSMIALNLIFSKQSEIAAAFAFQKLNQSPPTGGTTALGISISPEPFLNLVLPFFQELKWVGPADVEMKIDQRDSMPKLIEINPRFSGAIAFSVHCGLNIPNIYVREASSSTSDQKGNFAKYEVGRYYINRLKYIRSISSTFFKTKNPNTLWAFLKIFLTVGDTHFLRSSDFFFRASKLIHELKEMIFGKKRSN
jgi:biotin carboxylase